MTKSVPSLFSARYQLVAKLGRGGFGEVWRVEDRELRCPVALKILREDAWGYVEEKRFRREGVITAGLRHPGLVVVYDAGEHLGRRGLKPANLFLQDDVRIKVCDCGIAHSSESTKGLTPDGHVMGTFEYLSPEQGRAEQVYA
ncbi:hypothetical protein [Streptomyces erythrochromogenes]|uniref:hypothetical protein n=1 Tax=Streptomyces erythrochromogenes TaxID=285574 RepID=UPI00386701E8|nr:hypothetical protein OG364_01060 [Streptomyces erythrochromogenes]WST98342.1 hypothetical protein OG364_40480 [Streptomyces erythrochromogenes]